MRTLVLPLTFSHALSPHLLVTSKIATHKTYVKSEWCPHERTLTERHTKYNNTNTMCRCTWVQQTTLVLQCTINAKPNEFLAQCQTNWTGNVTGLKSDSWLMCTLANLSFSVIKWNSYDMYMYMYAPDQSTRIKCKEETPTCLCMLIYL